MAKVKSIVKKGKFYRFEYDLYCLCAQIIIFIKTLYVRGEIYSDMDKIGDLMCQFCVCCSNIYYLYMYKHETVRNQLIGYLIFIPVSWNLETINRLASYSVKVHRTITNGMAQFHWKVLLYHCRLVLYLRTRMITKISHISLTCNDGLEA